MAASKYLVKILLVLQIMAGSMFASGLPCVTTKVFGTCLLAEASSEIAASTEAQGKPQFTTPIAAIVFFKII